MPQIVQITERVIRDARPDLLQQKGALVSLGATAIPLGQSAFCTSVADVQALIETAGPEVQAFYNQGDAAPTLRGQAAKGDARHLADPPVVGGSQPTGLPFTIKDVVFTNTDAIAKGAATATLAIKDIATLPANFIPGSLAFTNLRQQGNAMAGATIAVGTDDGKTLTLNVTFPSGGAPADIAAQSAWEVDIAGQSEFDNSQAVADLLSAARSWFANANAGVWVVELGPAQPTNMGSLFQAWLAQNPLAFYGYVLPRGAANDATMMPVFEDNAKDNSRVFFFMCGDPGNYTGLIQNDLGLKSVFYGAEYVGASVAPGTTAADQNQENLAAAVCAQFLSARPSSVNQLAPMSFRQLVGITPWPEAGNAATFARFQRDNVGFGGLSNTLGTILFWGTFMNGDDMGSWYGADWTAINLGSALTNAIISGSQPAMGARPLFYDQTGINRLEGVAQVTLQRASAYGCILPVFELSAVSFNDYVTAQPQDFEAGVYNGLAATITPARGFLKLTVGLDVDFTGQSAVTTTLTNAA
ncbi:hypothetical protein E3E12_08075 [Formicincola oecophyllae]|uniref:Uncharacterized protein n=1 Tax=Formicincola oecophyllae TaxID=2558361 RepID=A0A4Y6U9K4_9PROT|nr:hypothetical protein [Formicincola oecophyllae]QDH14153.1 hypothetical protein E3E12_08075 [Formicincola oecophyllae]